MKTITLNGEEKEFGDDDFPQTIKDLAEKLGLKTGAMIAEVNGKIVKNTEFEQFKIEPESSIELVQFVGGG